MKKKLWYLLLLFSLCTVCGCSKPAEAPKVTSTPAPTLSPSPSPTSTPSPTPTLSPTPTAEPKLTSEEIYKTCGSGVVVVDAGVSTGTGFFIDKNIILTNYHVIDQATELFIRTSDGVKHDVLEVLGYNETVDLAILKVDTTGTPLKYNSHGISIGEKTYTIGNSLGIAHTFSDGMVTNKDYYENGVNYILTNTAISGGNSGGPLLNEYGEVMGITTFTFINGQNMNCAVEISQLLLVSTSNPVSTAEYLKAIAKEEEDEYFYEDSAKSGDAKTAQTIPEGELLIGVLETDEIIDYYKFTVPKNKTYSFTYVIYDNVQLVLTDESANTIVRRLIPEEAESIYSEYIYLTAGEYYVVAYESKDLALTADGEYCLYYGSLETLYEDKAYSGKKSTAMTVPMEETILGKIEPGDTDYYGFEITNADMYRLHYRTLNPEEIDMGIAKSSTASGYFWYTFATDPAGSSSEVILYLTPGTYYFMAQDNTVSGCSETAANDYSFRIEPYEVDFTWMEDYAVDENGEVMFYPYINEVLEANSQSNGLYPLFLSSSETKQLINLVTQMLPNADVQNYPDYYIWGFVNENNVESYYYDIYECTDKNDPNNYVALYLEKFSQDFVELVISNPSKEEAFRMANEVIAFLELDYYLNADSVSELNAFMDYMHYDVTLENGYYRINVYSRPW